MLDFITVIKFIFYSYFAALIMCPRVIKFSPLHYINFNRIFWAFLIQIEIFIEPDGLYFNLILR